MSKAKQRKVVEQPQLSPIDLIGALSDDELHAKRNELETLRESLLKSNRAVKQIEVELAYVQREGQLRNIRHDRHEQWLRAVASYEDNEDMLPNVDFNNIDFVRLHAEYYANLERRRAQRARC